MIHRLTKSYGPTLQMSDTKALSQFIKQGLAKENIVLKSAGTQYYSYCYTADSVSGLLTILLKGESGEAYNIADESSDVTLRDMAKIIADYVGTKVIFETPDATEAAGYSKATKARLDGSKLRGLGWRAQFNMRKGVQRPLGILKNTLEL